MYVYIYIYVIYTYPRSEAVVPSFYQVAGFGSRFLVQSFSLDLAVFVHRCFKLLWFRLAEIKKKNELEKSSKVGYLKRSAQKILGENSLSLVTSEGHVLKDPGKSLEAAGVSDGDHLTAVVQQGKLAAAAGAFAFWSDGGDQIVTWDHDKVSHNCAAVQDNFGSVQLVQGT